MFSTKIHKVLFLIIFIFNIFIKSELDKDKLFRTISGLHIRTFSKDNLLSEPLEFKEKEQEKTNVQLWLESIKELEKFVKQKTDDKKILQILDDSLKLNTELITSVKIAYNTDFANKNNVPSAKNQKEFTAKFKDLYNKAKKLSNNLESSIATKLWQKVTSKKDSKDADIQKEIKDLLKNFLLILETTSQKAQNDYSKESAKRSKK